MTQKSIFLGGTLPVYFVETGNRGEEVFSTLYLVENLLTSLSAIATVSTGTVVSNLRITPVITNATTSAASLSNFGLPEANCSVTVATVKVNIQAVPARSSCSTGFGSVTPQVNVSASAVSATTGLGSAVPQLLVKTTSASATAITQSIIMLPKVSIATGVGTVIPKVVSTTLQASASASAISPISSIFDKVFSAYISAAAASVSPVLAISSATASVSTSAKNVNLEVDTTITQASVIISIGGVIASVSKASQVTQAGCSVEVAGIRLKEDANVLSASASTTAKDISKSLFAFVLPAPVAATAFPVIPNPEAAITGVTATTTASNTWDAGVPSQAYCWTVLGVLRFEIASTWEPGRGVKLRGKSSNVGFTGKSSDTRLAGKVDTNRNKNKYRERIF